MDAMFVPHWVADSAIRVANDFGIFVRHIVSSCLNK